MNDIQTKPASYIPISLDKCIFLDIETIPVDTYERVSTLPEYEWLFRLWNKRVDLRKKKGEISEIETPEKIWESAALYPEYNKILCITMGYIHKGEYRSKTYSNYDEKVLIENYLFDLNKLIKIGKTKLVGASILKFDIPVLFRKSIIYGYHPTNIVAQYDRKPWENPVIDVCELWRLKTYNGDATLDSIARCLNLESSKGSLDGSKVYEAYLNDQLEDIIAYCERDVKILYEILNYLQNLNYIY